jgi:magnesium transporter
VIRVFRCNGQERSWGGVELLANASGSTVLWIDLEAPTAEEEAAIFGQFFPIHALSLEDVRRPGTAADASAHLPRVEEFPDYLFVIVNPLRPVLAAGQARTERDRQALNTQLSAVMTRQVLITHHQESIASVEALRAHLEKHEDHGQRGPDFLFHLILDEMVDEYIPVLDQIDDELETLETAVFARPNEKLLNRLLRLKRLVVRLRKTMIAEREVLSRLHRGEFLIIDEREKVYYRNVYDHLLRFTELIEASREMISDLMQTLLASQANRLNGIMKVLTMISVTILPMSLIAGIYGMNFEHNVWPDFKTSVYGFWSAIGLMALSGVIAFLSFRWVRWL